MPIITRIEVDAWAFCAQQVDANGELSYDADAIPEGDDRCPGHEQVKVRAVRELIQFTYADANGQAGAGNDTPVDTILAGQVEACIHFAGEEPYDAERGRFLAKQIDETCEPAKRDLPRLIEKYVLDPKASARLEVIKAQYEDGLGPL